MKVLVLNAGSSSQKSCLYDLEDASALASNAVFWTNALSKPVWQAQIEWTDQESHTQLAITTANGTTLQDAYQSDSKRADLLKALQTLWSGETQVIKSPQEINVVGHRVVHGGQKYRHSVWIDAEVKRAIAELGEFAPSHNPANLEGIEAIESILGSSIAQIAVFDTAFHAHLTPAVYTYPGPYEWLAQGIRRYGFHGISHQYCAQRAAQILNRDLNSLKLITCHLGNGCSLAAIRDGYSIDTTMGFTPLEGLMMGTRSGSVDPSILIHLLRLSKCTVDQLDHILNHDSGLLGISGLSNDMRQIRTAIKQGNDRAKLAFDIFIHRLCSQIGAMLASLGRIDALIFTGGIGENCVVTRAAVCEAFEFIGLSLNVTQNDTHPIDQDIAQSDSKVRILVVHTDEAWVIAQECYTMMS
jgi:acetate kinase